MLLQTILNILARTISITTSNNHDSGWNAWGVAPIF